MIASGFQLCSPFGIVSGLLLMLSAVYFNHEPLLKANEIGDIRSERMLPSELELLQIPLSKQLP